VFYQEKFLKKEKNLYTIRIVLNSMYTVYKNFVILISEVSTGNQTT